MKEVRIFLVEMIGFFVVIRAALIGFFKVTLFMLGLIVCLAIINVCPMAITLVINT